jgi:fatty-acyl-CoA synthase
MQDFPLTLPHLFERAERFHADKELVTATASGRERTTYGAWADRAHRLGGVLDALGVSPGGRVGTFGWNTARHLELYFAVPCTGRVLHTLNIRLSAEQLAYVIDHAHDEIVFVDRSLAQLLLPLLGELPSVKHLVVMDDAPDHLAQIDTRPAGPAVHDYETLLADATPARFAVDDESRAASMCYTSGTTGNPKGVVYTHRSMFLHTLGVLAADTFAVGERDRVLPIVPMFHANAWGLAHAAVAAGSTLVLPGADLSPRAVAELIEAERVTVAAGVPTIWMGVLPELDGRDTTDLRSIICGGSAVPRALSEAYRSTIGLPILQAWGMTETSPLGAVCHITTTLDEALDDEGRADLRTSIGQPVVGVETRITPPGAGNGAVPLAWDGETPGELQVRGPWIAAGYHDDPRSPESFTDDGWLRTGDIATIDRQGYVRLVDRTKDVIKSGGEWISSVTLENEVMAHPDVAEAAVVGVTHAKWGERPLACVVLRPGRETGPETKAELVAFLQPRIPKWWLPDDIVFIDQIPKTSVGKFDKKTLRATLSNRPAALPT